uniref:Uncharacterized protein n=2 Tax=Zea mays TaxID=4577 RepID=A0A804MWQ6_MAIZE
MPEDEKEKFKEFLKEKVRERKRELKQAKEARRKAIDDMDPKGKGVVKFDHKVRLSIENEVVVQLVDSFMNPVESSKSKLKFWLTFASITTLDKQLSPCPFEVTVLAGEAGQNKKRQNERYMQKLTRSRLRDRIGDTLDFEIKRWSNGKQGNLRALLLTLQYIRPSDKKVDYQIQKLTNAADNATAREKLGNAEANGKDGHSDEEDLLKYRPNPDMMDTDWS